MRDVARGVYPQLLSQHGVAEALVSVTGDGSLSVEVHDLGLGRHTEGLELTVYSCRLEALKNAAAHAGPGASATVRLREDGDGIHFSVEDDGVGFDPAAVGRTSGLTDIADRAAAAGGALWVEIHTRPRHADRRPDPGLVSHES